VIAKPTATTEAASIGTAWRKLTNFVLATLPAEEQNRSAGYNH
jgi:hypothetical protein